MKHLTLPFLIGVDGGGTSCRVGLAVGGWRFDVTLGPANAATDRGGAIATVCAGIAQVIDMAGHDMPGAADPVNTANTRVFVALAGVKNAGDERDLAAAIQQRTGLDHVRVSEDQVSTVRGALQDGDGTVAAIGTGSFLARQAGDQRTYIGGWGFDLGDEASGAWLGRQVLAATLLVQDGLLAGSPVCTAMMERFGDAAGIVDFVAGASPGQVGALAPLVVAQAQEGDAVARALMQKGADYIERGVAALGHRAGDMLVLTGGVGPAYAALLPKVLRADLCGAKGNALDGAIFLAGKMQAGA